MGLIKPTTLEVIMGYRSEVRSCIYSDDLELFDAFIAGQKLAEPRVFDDSNWFKDNIRFTEVVYKDVQGVIVQHIKILDLQCDDVKWYTDFDDVKAWHKMLINAEEQGLNYEFVRVGEESDDIEREEGGESVEHFLYPTTSISCEYN
jgi:hypothetical protein